MNLEAAIVQWYQNDHSPKCVNTAEIDLDCKLCQACNVLEVYARMFLAARGENN